MNFRKRLIEELDLSPIAANTIYSIYIDVCEKVAKEYAKEQAKQITELKDALEAISSMNVGEGGDSWDMQEVAKQALKDK